MEVNWLALVVAAISTMVVGFVWYNPKVFGNVWMKSLGMTEEDAAGGNMPVIFGTALVLAFLAAMFISQIVIHGGEEHATFKHGAFHGAMVGVFLATPVLVTNALFERRNLSYMLINAGYWIVSFAIVGGIVCAWQ